MTVPASHPPADRAVELADLTTLRLGGPVGELVEARDEESLVEAVRSADDAGTPVLLVGGGSNLVVADEGYAGRVVLIRNGGISEESDLCGGAYVEIGAGENWDDVVATAVHKGWVGIEALSGIPGTTGATPIQNVGAYGQEVSQTVARVRTWDRKLRGIRTFAADECSFGYRTSRFKQDPGRFVVLSTTFQFRLGDLGPPCSTPSWPAPSASPSASVPPRMRCAKPYSTCVGARRWCSTRRTTTPGARGRSSPTRSSRRTPYPTVRRPGRSRRGWSRRALPG